MRAHARTEGSYGHGVSSEGHRLSFRPAVAARQVCVNQALHPRLLCCATITQLMIYQYHLSVFLISQMGVGGRQW